MSQGGDLSWLLAIPYPHLVKASFPLLGFIHRQAYEQLQKPKKRVPIFVFQGEEDKIVSIRYTRKEVALLERRAMISSYLLTRELVMTYHLKWNMTIPG